MKPHEYSTEVDRVRAAIVRAAARRIQILFDQKGQEARKALECAVEQLSSSGWPPSFVHVAGARDTEAHFNRIIGWWVRDDDHGAGYAFLSALATKVGLIAMVQDIAAGNKPVIRVEESLEHNTSKMPDLVVLTKNAALMIENKVNAPESGDQFGPYLASFRKEAGERSHAAVLASRDERECPSDWSHFLLHSDIASLLRDLSIDPTFRFWTRVAARISATAFDNAQSPWAAEQESRQLLAKTAVGLISPADGSRMRQLAAMASSVSSFGECIS